MKGVTMLAVSLCLAGCAADPVLPPAALPRVRMAVAPAEWATEQSVEVDVSTAIRSGFDGTRVDVVATQAEIDRRGAECAADPRCAESVARDLEADKLVQTRLATLGGTVLVRVGLVDVSSGTRDEERQEIVNEATAARVEAALAGIARGLARPYAPPPKIPEPRSEWYEEWWVWALVGTAVVGTGVGVGVAVVSREPGPDVVITPP